MKELIDQICHDMGLHYDESAGVIYSDAGTSVFEIPVLDPENTAGINSEIMCLSLMEMALSSKLDNIDHFQVITWKEHNPEEPGVYYVKHPKGLSRAEWTGDHWIHYAPGSGTFVSFFHGITHYTTDL